MKRIHTPSPEHGQASPSQSAGDLLDRPRHEGKPTPFAPVSPPVRRGIHRAHLGGECFARRGGTRRDGRPQSRPLASSTQSNLRFGIFSGVVIGGSIGGRDRLEYTVTGDAVNTASRLESADKDSADWELGDHRCRILAGETTVALLGGEFEVQRIGAMALPGKKLKVTVYSITGERGAPAQSV